VTLKGYRLWAPLEGRTLVPLDPLRQVLELKLLPAGSRRFLSDEGIESLLREAAERSKEQVNQTGKPREVELGRYVAEWARRNGLGARQVKQEVERWVAEVERTRGDERKLALAAFARGDYAVAAEHAEAAAERKLRQLEELEQERRRLQLEAAQDLTLRGDVHFSGYAFDKALESYERALR
jgi:tetratricopeptide (TPR) repeat protein